MLTQKTTAKHSHTTETASGRSIAANAEAMKFVTPKNGTRNTVNGSSTEFTGRISAVISKPDAAPIAISADAIVSRHIAVLCFRHAHTSSDISTINTALTQSLPALAEPP